MLLLRSLLENLLVVLTTAPVVVSCHSSAGMDGASMLGSGAMSSIGDAG